MKRIDLEHIIRAAGSITQDVAGRERDLEFASEAINQGLVQKEILRQRVSMLRIEESIKDRLLKRIGK